MTERMPDRTWPTEQLFVALLRAASVVKLAAHDLNAGCKINPEGLTEAGEMVDACTDLLKQRLSRPYDT